MSEDIGGACGDIPHFEAQGATHFQDSLDAEGWAWADPDTVFGAVEDREGELDDLGAFLRAVGSGEAGAALREGDGSDYAISRRGSLKAYWREMAPLPSALAGQVTVSWGTVPECELLMHSYARRFADSVRPVVLDLYADLRNAVRQENLGRSLTCLPKIELPSLSAFARHIAR